MGPGRSETPGSGGCPSGRRHQQITTIKRAKSAKTINTHGHPKCSATYPPTVGASKGETPRIKIKREIILAVSCTGKKSRTMAMEATCAAQPPSACKKRIATNHPTVRENKHRIDATINKVSPAYIGSLRPKRSSCGP